MKESRQVDIINTHNISISTAGRIGKAMIFHRVTNHSDACNTIYKVVFPQDQIQNIVKYIHFGKTICISSAGIYHDLVHQRVDLEIANKSLPAHKIPKCYPNGLSAVMIGKDIRIALTLSDEEVYVHYLTKEAFIDIFGC